MAPQREWFDTDYYAVLGVPRDAARPAGLFAASYPVSSTEPGGTVVAQTPAANSTARSSIS